MKPKLNAEKFRDRICFLDVEWHKGHSLGPSDRFTQAQCSVRQEESTDLLRCEAGWHLVSVRQLLNF